MHSYSTTLSLVHHCSRYQLESCDVVAVIQMMTCLKGISDLLQDCQSWLMPLLEQHAVAQMQQFLSRKLPSIASACASNGHVQQLATEVQGCLLGQAVDLNTTQWRFDRDVTGSTGPGSFMPGEDVHMNIANPMAEDPPGTVSEAFGVAGMAPATAMAASHPSAAAAVMPAGPVAEGFGFGLRLPRSMRRRSSEPSASAPEQAATGSEDVQAEPGPTHAGASQAVESAFAATSSHALAAGQSSSISQTLLVEHAATHSMTAEREMESSSSRSWLKRLLSTRVTSEYEQMNIPEQAPQVAREQSGEEDEEWRHLFGGRLSEVEESQVNLEMSRTSVLSAVPDEEQETDNGIITLRAFMVLETASVPEASAAAGEPVQHAASQSRKPSFLAKLLRRQSADTQVSQVEQQHRNAEVLEQQSVKQHREHGKDQPQQAVMQEQLEGDAGVDEGHPGETHTAVRSWFTSEVQHHPSTSDSSSSASEASSGDAAFEPAAAFQEGAPEASLVGAKIAFFNSVTRRLKRAQQTATAMRQHPIATAGPAADVNQAAEVSSAESDVIATTRTAQTSSHEAGGVCETSTQAMLHQWQGEPHLPVSPTAVDVADAPMLVAQQGMQQTRSATYGTGAAAVLAGTDSMETQPHPQPMLAESSTAAHIPASGGLARQDTADSIAQQGELPQPIEAK